MRMRNFTKLLMLFVLCLVGMQGNAQNVTVRPSTGSMIAAVKDGGQTDTYFRRNGFATWRHNQLCLTMTTSDGKAKTPNGQLANPANNIYGDVNANELQVAKGALGMTCYLNFALPKGYRFTGYQIVFSRNKSDFGDDGYRDNPNTSGTTYFGETDESFNFKAGRVEGVTYNANATMESGSTTISYEDNEGMSNILYFKVSAQRNGTESGNAESISNGSGRMVITLHSVTLWFTAEDDYTPVLPQANITVPVSAVDIPFQTGKVDYGSIERRQYNGANRVSYSSANVIDMTANMTLYEAESVIGGSHFDGTSGDVVDYKEGAEYSIRNHNDFFMLGKKDQEQVYYIETPTYVVLPDVNGTKNPVGFRIVGAELEYQFGTALPATQVSKTRHYITYTSNGTTYYLNKSGKFVTSEKTEWFSDDDGRVYSGTTYLGINVQTDWSGDPTSYTFATYSTVPNHPLTVYNNQYLRGSYTYNWGFSTDYIYLIGSTSNATVSTSTSNRASWETSTTSASLEAFTPAPFKLHIYGKDGVELSDSPIEVNSADDNGKVTLTGFNNDAVKFGVEGIGFVKGTLTMQALDPYIDAMSVVCQDGEKGKESIRMTEPFNANDFSVSGGEFFFYLPSDCVGDKVKITYEDLWSHYADETYEGGSSDHNSRFSFVNSAHYNEYTSDNIYNNVAEAAADKDNVKERQIVSSVGDKRFKFNNADELSTQAGTLTEYPFTLANYAASPNLGKFYTMEFVVSTSDQQQTAYVFTTDETRYNIAPTTAVQHRTYAFYEMIVHVQSTTYDPKVEIVKIYDKTFYDKNGADATDAYYGAVVTAPYGSNNEAGFASDLEVQEAIDKVITNKKDDFNHTDIPASAKQILYVDMTGLKGYYKNGQATQSLGEYRTSTLAPNAIVFLPKGALETENNFAAKTDGNNARASRNIILTDKQPFYSPYDIQVPSQNYAKYTRILTRPDYDKDLKAMVILPYALSIQSGKHVNPAVESENITEGKNSFDVMSMTSAILEEQSKDHNYGLTYFTKVSGEKTEANTPYMVKVDETSVEGDVSFVAMEMGALIKASTGMRTRTIPENQLETIDNKKADGTYKYLFFGASVESGTLDVPEKASLTLTPEGGYSGQAYDRGASEAIFYFANNIFYNLYKLTPAKRYLYAYPFHPVYAFEGTIPSEIPNSVKSLGGLDITFEDPGDLDYIHDTTKAFVPDLMVRSGKGYIQFTSDKDQTVNILSLNGTSYSRVTMNAGDSKTISLPAGIYVVNNVKIIVK